MNRLQELRSFGQSVWSDFISRGIIESGELHRMIVEDGVRGVTSNPAIFGKAIMETRDYDDEIKKLAKAGKSVADIYESMTVEDIRNAADILRPVYDTLHGEDGFVSIEVSPHLVHDVRDTIFEARRLWHDVSRPNIFIKVPASDEGLVAIRQLISEGINVNVTLLFGLQRYRQVANAYMEGLEDRLEHDKPIDNIASVASFFLSRIDVLVDPMLDEKIKAGGAHGQIAAQLRGEAAIACAKKAYQIYKEIVADSRHRRLAGRGARTQRVLWASTGTKDPSYSDIKYVEPLIGPETVNTMPLETIKAFLDHGQCAFRLEEDIDQVDQALRQFSEIGVNMESVAQQLEKQGEEKFCVPYDKCLKMLEDKRRAIRSAARVGVKT